MPRRLSSLLPVAAAALALTLGLPLSTGAQLQRRPAPVERPFCSSDELLRQSLQQDPELRGRMERNERALREIVAGRLAPGAKQPSSTSTFVVPVVVYVVHTLGQQLGQGENIDDPQIQSQIAALNVAFANQGIVFCLATKQGNLALPGSPTPGIIRIADDDLTDHQTSSEEPALKALSSLPGDRYLRIWVVKDIDNHSGIAGYARFPGTVPTALEGIVMRYDTFGNALDPTCNCSLLPNYDEGDILAHEVGHFLYLYHPFQGGCAGSSTSTCASNGDLICDTPQIAVASTGCPAGTVPSCNGTPTQINNQMDYTNDVCRNAFTPGQGLQMAATLTTLRPLLFSAQNLAYTGVQCAAGLSAGFSADNYNPCKNQPVTFTALSSGGSTYAWDFGDGSPLGAGASVVHSYATAGAHAVTLTVTSGSSVVSSVEQIFVTACSPIASSQGNWYFGNRAGLNFTTGSPVPALGAFQNGTISTLEGCASQSAPSGNLLFYSDGISVWDDNHVLLNPSTPLTGHLSSSQSALAVPVPGNPNRYYLFTVPSHQFNATAPFAYSVVDVSGGNVSLVATTVPVPLPAGATSVSEAATAIQKCNGDYWVVVRGYFNDPPPLRNSFYVYSVTAGGVTLAGTYPFANRSFVGQLKMSPDGTLLACSGGAAVVCDFNRATGVLTNPRNFPRGDYGISFSPDSRLFYTADFVGGPPQRIYQYDLTAANPGATGQAVATTPDIESSLQIGPDGKLYVSLIHKDHLAVLNFPNQRASSTNPNAPGFSYNGPSLVTAGSQAISSQLGLPNMVDALPPAQVPASFWHTTASCSTVQFHTGACATSYSWSFGDGSTSNATNPSHTYTGNGTYNVALTLNGSTTVNHAVTIGLPASAAIISGPTLLCTATGGPPFRNYSANPQPGLSYSWTVTGGAISGSSTGVAVDVVWSTLPGTLTLTVTNPVTGCTATKTLSVTADCCTPPPAVMVDWWTFDESTGTLASDVAGNFANVGNLVNGPTHVPGMVAGGLSFDGVNDYVQVANHPEVNFGTCVLDAAPPLTIDLWVKTTLPAAQLGANSGLLTILDKRVNPVQPNGYSLFLYRGRLGFQVHGANYVAPAAGPDYKDIADNQWHFIAVSLPMCRTTIGGFLYVDGQSVLALPPGPGITNAASLNIGRRDPTFGGNYFRGVMDELEIYHHALQPSDLDAIFAANSGGKCKGCQGSFPCE